MSGARDLALEVLRRVFTQGAFASAALRAALERAPNMQTNDRALATELVYGVLRRRGHLDRALSRTGKRLKDLDPKIHDILRLGAYQVMFLDRVPAHAAVDEAVEQAKRRAGPKAAGQVNAILRKLSASPAEERLPAPPDPKREPARHVAELGSVSLAMAEVLVADLGLERALAFVRASLEIAPLTLRTNRLRGARDALALEIGGTAGANLWSVHLPARGGALPADLLAVVEGRATPQDEASMQVVELLEPQEGDRVLDVCAAPGGKTTHIAELINDRGTIIAHDRLPDRLARVAESARRLGLSSISTVPILPALSDPKFDRVLVDAPCTGLGTMRRHPEIRWRFTKEQMGELAKIQSEVLREGAARLKVGGTLVYSVCTVTKAEGEAHLSEVPDFEVAAVLSTSPEQEGAPDGFFAAKLIKRR